MGNSSSLGIASSTDIVIIGGGLSGTLASIVLGKAGINVTLIDPDEVYPAEFRAERLVGPQLEQLRKLGLFDLLVQDKSQVGRTIATRAGHVVDVVLAPHYGIIYDGMVNKARRHLPPSVTFVKGKADKIELTADRQKVTLSGGEVIEGRLVIMATGHGQRLLRQLGITRKVLQRAHSTTLGFDIDCGSATPFHSSALVAYGEKAAGSIDYITIFPEGGKVRANLFSYDDHRNGWIERFRRQPLETLEEALPGLQRMIGKIRAGQTIQTRVMDLAIASNYLRDGIVLIGDAFLVSCPAAGTGIGRLLSDIDRLCTCFIPKWLASDGMDSAKIAQFYDDAEKKACDAEALRVAHYRRSFVTETSLRWKIHRRRVAWQNSLRLIMRPKLKRNATRFLRSKIFQE